MTKQRRYLGKWELGCIVFHLCVAKMFTQYPGSIAAASGSAAWLTVLYTSILFLVILFVALRFLPKNLDKTCLWRVYRWVVTVYWLLAAIYALKEGASVLHATSYFRSPDWFLMFFLLLGAVGTALCRAKAVYRMHSLLVLPVGVILVVLALFGLRNAEVYNLAPLFGSGKEAVFGRGLSALFLYLDIPFLAVLLSRCRPEVAVKRTVFSSAILGVAVNVVLMLISSMGQPFEMDISWGIPLYNLAKSGVGLGALYLIGFLISAMLYLALALHLIALSAKGLLKKFSGRRIAAMLCLLLCLPLTGCYDSREVEETAYLIALGIDKGENAPYRYTFQISNPLETGKTADEENPEEPPAEKQEKPNKGVNNLFVESDNFYLALSQIRSQLGKEPDLSHMKIIVFSKELARENLTEQTELLYEEREIRPDTNLCLAESAQEFLTAVQPTLEQSTARYYELMFQRRYSPYAPVTELKEFVTDCRNSGRDPVLPIADKEQVAGMGIFDSGTLIAKGDSRRAMMYKFLAGEAEGLTVKAGDSVFLVKSQKKPQIQIDQNEIGVEPSLKAILLQGKEEDSAILAAMLEEEMTNLLRETAALSVDILGLGNYARKSHLTQEKWTNSDWNQQLKKASIFTKTSLTLEDSR